jgi:hypothetical protein
LALLYPPGIEEDPLAIDRWEFMLHQEILKLSIFRKYILKEMPESGIVRFPVSQIVKELPLPVRSL